MIRSSLGKHQVSSMNEDELDNHRRRAYHEQNIYIFTPEQRGELDYSEQLALEAAAIRVYGKRRK
jgi:hypothetical protein